MVYPYYIFGAALLFFLLYNYRQVIKEKLGYHDKDTMLTRSVENLQLELRGTADAIIEQFAAENQRLEKVLARATERIAELENLLKATEALQPAHNKSKLSVEKEKQSVSRDPIAEQAEAQRIRLVAKMAAQGMDVHAIGKMTGLSYSEVRVLLNIVQRTTF